MPGDQTPAWHAYSANAELDGEMILVKPGVRKTADGPRLLDHCECPAICTIPPVEKTIREPGFASPQPLSRSCRNTSVRMRMHRFSQHEDLRGHTDAYSADAGHLDAWLDAVGTAVLMKLPDGPVQL
ncbi:MAG: hypothetical protein KF778_12660 [Rhodocyclaceae bacterium]|nr:hypothetical protein [Rhodocyclaceae bacterium]MBX3669245.1 hypothetical protein [Rhodocyclaceae bacterium]